MFEEYEERYSRLFLPLFVGVAILLVFAGGKSTPIHVPDTPSYLDYPFDSVTGMGQAIRTPGYPIWLWLIGATVGLAWLPVAHAVAHALASWCFFREIRRWGMSTGTALVVAATIGVGCTAMDNVAVVSSDCLAASFGVLTVTCLMRWTRRGDSWETIAGLVLTIFISAMIRPAYLFLIPWVVVGALLLHRFDEGSSFGSSLWRSLRVAFLVVLLLLGWMTFRFASAGDFGLLPFGHQNLAGVLVQLLDDRELASLPAESGELGEAIAAARQRYADEVGFEAGEPGATMTIENNWDEMTYLVVIPAAKRVAGDENVAYHNRLKKLNRSIIGNYPTRYAIWLVKAVRRGAWGIAANLVMHPIFLLGLITMLLMVLHRAFWDGYACGESVDSVDLRALTLIAFSYAGAKVVFVVITSPPIGRFSDAAAIFIPGFIAAVFIRWWNSPAE